MNDDFFFQPEVTSKRLRRHSVPELGEFPVEDGRVVSTLQLPSKQFSLRPVMLISLLFLLLLLARVFFLQVVHGADYRAAAEDNRTQTIITKSLRGVVYDRQGNALAKNVPNFALVIYAREIPRADKELFDSAIQEMSDVTAIAREELDVIVEESLISGQPITVRDQIPYEEAMHLMIVLDGIAGAYVETHYQREYLQADLYAHVLGYTGKMTAEEYEVYREQNYLLNDVVGKTGIELSYEEQLHGTDGRTQVEVDFQGRQKHVISANDAEAGWNVHLAVDGRLQQLLHDRIAEVVDEQGLPGAAAVAIDPATGKVRALVSYPSYDNNAFINGISSDEYAVLRDDERNPLFHRAVSGTYPSGSTFKPIVAAAGLEEGVVRPSDTVLSTGGLDIDIYSFPDWKAGGHGVTNLYKAIAESVNTYFYLLGGGDNETTTGLGVERIVDYGRKFGLAADTGIDLPNEASGFLPSKAWKEEFKNEPWYIGDTYHLAIGQGDILVTPLQMSLVTATIANGGTLREPRVVDYFTDQHNNRTETVEAPVRAEQVVSSGTMQEVQRAMRETVLTGSARSLLTLPVTSAAKTGTAQFGAEDKTHSWFTVFAPYEQPEIALAIIIQEGGGSNDTAVPIGREVLREYFAEEETESGSEEAILESNQ